MSPETQTTEDQVTDATRTLRHIVTDARTPSIRLALALLANPRGIPVAEYDTNHGEHTTRQDISLLNTNHLANTPFRILRKNIEDISGETRRVITLTLRATDEQIILTPPKKAKDKRKLIDQIIPQAAWVGNLRRRLEEAEERLEALLVECRRLNEQTSSQPPPEGE